MITNIMSIFSQTHRCLLNQRSNIFANQKRFSVLESIHRTTTTESDNFARNHMLADHEPNCNRRMYRLSKETCQAKTTEIKKIHSLDNSLVNNHLLDDINPPCSYNNSITRKPNVGCTKFIAKTNSSLNIETLNSFNYVGTPITSNYQSFNYNVDYKYHKKYKNSNSYEQRSHNKDHHNYRCHQHHNHQNHHHIVSLLAVMGLFKKMSTGDIEEEKSKLSDEQKIKKMNPTEILIAKGVLSMCDQDYTKANELFHKALRLSQDENNEEQETLILNLLASNFFEADDFDNAEKLFIDLIKRMIANNVEPTDPAILELSLKLASIYSKNKLTHEKAIKGFKFVINSLLLRLEDIVINVGDLDVKDLSDDKKDQLALLGWSYDWFAKHLLSINDYNGAAEMLKKALEISSKVLGPNHDQTLILLNDVGTTMAMNNDPEEGKTFLQKAVEGAIESQSKELASFYVNLGLVNLKLRKFNEAKRYCEYSIELATKNSEHHNSGDILKLSQHCLSEIKRLKEIVN